MSESPFLPGQGCLGDDDAQRLAAGLVESDVRAKFEAHLASCAECRELVSALTSDVAVLAQTRSASEPPLPPEILPAGTQVGRFQVISSLGSGAMGQVYRAHDPQLDRTVALKVLAAGTGIRPKTWLQEGRAQARLSHPHVVAVFEAFTWSDRVVLALELVEGRTLRQWLKDERPTWRKILEVFLAAGEGLAAAHRAGIVHRDFKPDNVLVGDDGRVRVADFGLAAATAAVPSARVGETSSMAGTPAYMAPEQIDRALADPRADQFAFSVSLYEALYGRRPFEATTLAELRAAIHRGTPRTRAPDSPVPRWVWGRIARGLAENPSERYVNMAGLLAALRRDPRALALRLAVTGVVLGLALSGWAPWRRAEPGARCVAEGNAELALRWGGAAHAGLQRAFVERGSSADLALKDLDGWAARWRAQWAAHCQAAADTDADTHLAAQCLHRDLLELGATTALLSQASSTDVASAAWSALDALPDPALCLRRPAAGRALEPVTAEVHERLAAAVALLRLGRVQEAKGAFEQLAASLDASPGVRAQVLAQLGQTLRQLGDLPGAELQLTQALQLAAQAGDTDEVARLWIERVALAGRKPDGLAELERLVEVAQLAVVQAGDEPELQAALLGARAAGLARHRKPLDARAALARALELRARAGLPNDSANEELTAELAAALRDLGVADGAVETGSRAVALREARLGPNHPLLAPLLGQLSSSLRQARQYPAAVEAARRETRLLAAALGPTHAAVQGAKLDVANALWEGGDPAASRVEALSALGVLRTMPDEWSRTARALNLVGICHQLAGESADAIAVWNEAIELMEAHGATTQLQYAHIVGNLGGALMERRETARAEAVLLKALAVTRDGQEPLPVLRILSQLGTVQLLAGRPMEALETLDRAVALCEQTPERRCEGLHGNRGRALVELARFSEAMPELEQGLRWDSKDGFDRQIFHFYRARARWESGDHDGALTDAHAALGGFAGAGQRGEFWAGDVQRWLRAHAERAR